MAEIDNRYCRGMIYTIRNIKDDAMIYVGSTINNLSKRFNSHKKACKAGLAVSLYSYIENNDWSDFYIELYEAYPCNNRKELDRREGQVIREIGTINKCIAGRTMKEYYVDNPDKLKNYYKDNADKIKEKVKNYQKNNADKIKEKVKVYRECNADIIKENAKQWRENNADIIKEKRKEKVCCNICGVYTSKHHFARHQKSKSCISKIPNNTDIPTDNHI